MTAKSFSRMTVLLIVLLLQAAAFAQIPKAYKGKPFCDSVYTRGPQLIPGRVELALYDLGGEGVAYHDTTPENEGSKLNHTEGHWRPGTPAYIVFFREQ